CIDSLGSTGETVRPSRSQKRTCTRNATWTPRSTAARSGPALLLRMRRRPPPSGEPARLAAPSRFDASLDAPPPCAASARRTGSENDPSGLLRARVALGVRRGKGREVIGESSARAREHNAKGTLSVL